MYSQSVLYDSCANCSTWELAKLILLHRALITSVRTWLRTSIVWISVPNLVSSSSVCSSLNSCKEKHPGFLVWTRGMWALVVAGRARVQQACAPQFSLIRKQGVKSSDFFYQINTTLQNKLWEAPQVVHLPIFSYKCTCMVKGRGLAWSQR
jgi:hypothetical protein